MPAATARNRCVIVVGLDGAEPSLVFDLWRKDLPTLDRLMRHGVYGRLESTIPAITVPAWASMMSGLDPGQLGVYGFRNRSDWSYDRLAIANSTAVRHPRVWDLLSAAGRRVGVIGVPQTYPVRPVNGHVVGCFLTPSARSEYTFPLSLKRDIARWIDGEFLVDVPNFRSDDKDRILRDIYRMADQHFEVCRRLLRAGRYDFFMSVDMGTDRIQHALWRYMDPRHPKYEPNHALASAIHDYYVHVDALIDELLHLVPDDSIVLVVSDHGAQAMLGGVCFNEWLIKEGDLTLEAYPSTLQPVDAAAIRWPETRAWGEGGYHGRLSMNVSGREPAGVIKPADYERERDRIADGIAAISDPAGMPIGSRAFRPEEIYREVTNVPPDLLVYFGDLTWRSVGSVGLRSIWTFENDTGPDDANHARHGIFIAYDPTRDESGAQLPDLQIYDVGPTIMEWFGLDIPAGLRGRPMSLWQ